MAKYWDILKKDPVLTQYVDRYPSITFRRSKNVRDLLVRSHYQGLSQERAFGSKRPKWGCQSCGDCLAYSNIDTATHIPNSIGSREFLHYSHY